MELQHAPDIQMNVKELASILGMDHVQPEGIICMRSFKSKSNALARIWSFPRIWQMALNKGPHYVIEVLSEKFDRMTQEEQLKVLIHELLHIPQTFSGALVPHKCFGRRIDDKRVDILYKKYKEQKREREDFL